MGSQPSKNLDQKEEIIFAQNRAGNSAKAIQEEPVQKDATLVAMVTIIFLYMVWKKKSTNT